MKRQRVKFIILIAAVAVIAAGWITIGTGGEEVPYVSIAELLEKKDSWKQDRFRLGGRIEEGSITYAPDRLSVDFVLIQGETDLPVHYNGLTPDMFKDDAEVIVIGRLNGENFHAEELMTKCASRYEVEYTGKDPDNSAEI
jgi:cytochrome c-type biogenesis protein CcmE